MAELAFTDLGLSVNARVKQMMFNNQSIDVKLYLPVNEKLDLISWVINQSADDLKFYNVGKLDIFKTIAMVKYYTNLILSDEQLNDSAHLYDLIISSDLFNQLSNVIPVTEIYWIDETLGNTIDSIYKYQNSIMGILDTVTTDYSNLNFDMEQLQKNIADPNNLTLLKDVMTKLG